MVIESDVVEATWTDFAELEPDEARFRLFDSLTSFLKTAAKSRPLMIVLDDLHWADKPSLMLLQFLARELAGSRIAVLATYRDVEVYAPERVPADAPQLTVSNHFGGLSNLNRPLPSSASR